MHGRKRKQSGTSLVETMVALAILGVVASLAAGSIGFSTKQMKVEDAKSALNLLGMRLRQELSNTDHLRTSADHNDGKTNKDFLNCISPDMECIATKPSERRTFSLYRLEKSTLGITSAVRILGSSLNDPVYYGTRGEICTNAAASTCLFRAYADFWATCPLDSNNIPQAICSPSQTVNFRFVIELKPNLPTFYEALKGSRFPPSGSDLDFVVKVPTALIIQKGSVRACGVGQVQDGFLGDGSPRCRCPGSDKIVLPTDTCDNACPIDHYLKGFDATGKAECLSLTECSRSVSSCAEFAAKQSKCPCTCIETTAKVEKRCEEGQWITGVNFGNCTAKDNGKKGGTEPIICTGGFMLCCKSRF